MYNFLFYANRFKHILMNIRCLRVLFSGINGHHLDVGHAHTQAASIGVFWCDNGMVHIMQSVMNKYY